MQCNCYCITSLFVSEQECTDTDKGLAMANKCSFCSGTPNKSSQHMPQALLGLPGAVDIYKAGVSASLQKYFRSLRTTTLHAKVPLLIVSTPL